MRTPPIGTNGMQAYEIALGCMRLESLDATAADRLIGTAVDEGIDFFGIIRKLSGLGRRKPARFHGHAAGLPSFLALGSGDAFAKCEGAFKTLRTLRFAEFRRGKKRIAKVGLCSAVHLLFVLPTDVSRLNA